MSETPPIDPGNFIRRIAESGLGIRFSRGVVGKTGHGIIVVIFVWIIVVWRINQDWLQDAFLIASGLFATVLFAWWTLSTQGFAERNPAQAMLDGAEFNEYKRIEAAAKGWAEPSGPLAVEDYKSTLSDGNE